MTKRRYVLLAISAAVVVLGVLLVRAWSGQRTPMTIEITGEAGQRVAGRFEIDGVVHEASGVLPANFVFHARRLSYAVAPTDGSADQQISVKAAVAGMPSFSCSARGVKGWIVMRGAPWARGGGIAGMPPTELTQLQQ